MDKVEIQRIRVKYWGWYNTETFNKRKQTNKLSKQIFRKLKIGFIDTYIHQLLLNLWRREIFPWTSELVVLGCLSWCCPMLSQDQVSLFEMFPGSLCVTHTHQLTTSPLQSGLDILLEFNQVLTKSERLVSKITYLPFPYLNAIHWTNFRNRWCHLWKINLVNVVTIN